ncbi:MAG: phytanoyl-CoA dioxygenase [Bacteroidetes bacterium]|nr:MAG: phytanoyl-CoA dioxygenase [Bacteroidota bacterium]
MTKISIPFYELEDKLLQEQINFFNKHGFIQFKNFISREAVTILLLELNRVQRFLLESDIKKINGIPLKFGKDANGDPLIQRIAFTSYYSNTLTELLKDERLKLLLQLLGKYEGRIGEHEKDGLVFNHYVNVEESNFKQLGWHTDSPRDLFLGNRILPMLNVGLHLDDCAFDNGGLRVLPGTHKQNVFRLLFRKKYFIDNAADKKEVGFDIEAGDLTVHDGRLWHRVQQSPLKGEKSRRRVIYFPVITGSYQPKNAESPTPLYHKLGQFEFKKGIKPILISIKEQMKNNYLKRDVQ